MATVTFDHVWKKYGDLLLANIGTATRDGDLIRVVDYFADDAPARLTAFLRLSMAPTLSPCSR